MSKIRPRIITAMLALLTTLTVTACSSGEGAQNAVALGGTFQFHSPVDKLRFSTTKSNAPRCRTSPGHH